jgi:acetate kinase
MKILTLNCGSSSIKYKLYKKHKVVSEGSAERIGLSCPILRHFTNGAEYIVTESFTSHAEAMALIMKELLESDHALLKEANEIKAVGHRVVHGGEEFRGSALITDRVESKIKELIPLSPLHNPANLAGIRAARNFLPEAAHVAVFDTAFHHTIPEYVYRYAVPAEWYSRYKVRKYGFHGTSHLYVSKRAAVMLGKDPSDCNLITMHIGNGVSCTAVKNGVSIDTSMGMTPLDGAVMGTRTGEIDPAVSFYIMNETNATPAAVYDAMNKKSGLFGVTGTFSDRRDIAEYARKGSELCRLAINMETYRLKQYIGRYLVVLGRVDAIVFTAGAGENSAPIR